LLARVAGVAATLSLVVASAAIVGAQGLSPERTLHEMAALDNVAGLARAINGGVPVDVRNQAGETALHVAAREAHLFSAMMLIAKGANPNARDAQQRTPLHLAADGDARQVGERYQIVKLLVAKGSDRNAIDADGKRPVDYAKIVEFERALAPPVTSRKASPRR
jgi:ankyrin repeat protein